MVASLQEATLDEATLELQQLQAGWVVAGLLAGRVEEAALKLNQPSLGEATLEEAALKLPLREEAALNVSRQGHGGQRLELLQSFYFALEICATEFAERPMPELGRVQLAITANCQKIRVMHLPISLCILRRLQKSRCQCYFRFDCPTKLSRHHDRPRSSD